MFQVDCYALSDVGPGHQVAQGRFLLADVPAPGGLPATPTLPTEASEGSPSCSKIIAVADGMLGLPAGDRASEIVAETAHHFLATNLQRRGEWQPEALNCTLTAVPGKCAEALSRDVEQNPWEKGLGSTLTLGHVLWPKLYLIHVGDCRCYLGREGSVRQLTADQIADGTLAGHTLVESVNSASLRRRTLWSFIGDGAQNLSPQVVELELHVGDTLLFCTRGLTQGMDEQRITDLLRPDSSAAVACHHLVAAAHESGESDEMVVIVVRFREDANRRSV